MCIFVAVVVIVVAHREPEMDLQQKKKKRNKTNGYKMWCAFPLWHSFRIHLECMLCNQLIWMQRQRWRYYVDCTYWLIGVHISINLALEKPCAHIWSRIRLYSVHSTTHIQSYKFIHFFSLLFKPIFFL